MRGAKKSLYALSSLVFAGLVIAGVITSLIPVKTLAAPAQCYYQNGTNVRLYQLVDCMSTTPYNWALGFSISAEPIRQGPQENKCYMVRNDQNWPDVQNVADQGSAECNEWSGSAQQAAQEEPVCRSYGGTDDEYNDITADITKLSEISCDEFFQQLAAQDITLDGHPRPGMCYISMNSTVAEGKLTWDYDTCWGILAHFVAADQAAQAALNSSIENPSREENIKCSNPSGMTKEECTAELLQKNSLMSLLRRTVQFMTVIVGVVITAVIVWAGIEYASAGGDANKTAGAKNRIRNAIIALVAYIFLGAGLNWLVPGGLF